MTRNNYFNLDVKVNISNAKQYICPNTIRSLVDGSPWNQVSPYLRRGDSGHQTLCNRPWTLQEKSYIVQWPCISSSVKCYSVGCRRQCIHVVWAIRTGRVTTRNPGPAPRNHLSEIDYHPSQHELSVDQPFLAIRHVNLSHRAMYRGIRLTTTRPNKRLLHKVA